MMERPRAIFFIKVSCALVLLCYVILRNPLNFFTLEKWKHDLFKGYILTEHEKYYEVTRLRLELAELELHNVPSGGDDYQKIRKDLEDDVNTLNRIVKDYAFVQTFAKTPQESRQLLENIEKTLFRQIWNFPQQNKSTQEFIHRERAEIADLVQQKIYSLQNPEDCANAKKLVCTVDHGCGFGCIVHHIVYCLMTSYTSNRTLILNLKQKYKGRPWNETFLPLSSTCLDGSGATYGVWDGGGDNINAQVVAVGTFYSIDRDPTSPWARLSPTRVPPQFESRLMRVSNDALSWWIGQFTDYVMRFTPDTEKIIKEAKARNPFGRLNSNGTSNNVIQIGIHVRRTDKKKETDYYPLTAYLSYVEGYLKVREIIEGKPISGQIFLASDEPTVIEEAKELEKKTNKWKLQANESIARVSDLKHRYESGILGILTDVMMLADCEFVVCTFASNICKMVAELKEVELDYWGEVVALDEPYNFLEFNKTV